MAQRHRDAVQEHQRLAQAYIRDSSKTLVKFQAESELLIARYSDLGPAATLQFRALYGANLDRITVLRGQGAPQTAVQASGAGPSAPAAQAKKPAKKDKDKKDAKKASQDEEAGEEAAVSNQLGSASLCGCHCAFLIICSSLFSFKLINTKTLPPTPPGHRRRRGRPHLRRVQGQCHQGAASSHPRPPRSAGRDSLAGLHPSAPARL
jgi:ribosomal protein L12E/L44/L45/RPP1/RPP2